MSNVTQIVEALEDSAEEGTPVPVERILDHFDRRSIGALIMVPALLEITPIGGIPGLPTVLAFTIAIFAVQILIGREDMWLPGFISHRTIKAEKVRQAAEKLRPIAAWMDRHFGPHLPALVHTPAPRLAAVAILLLCASVPPLEFVPFASTFPMATIAMFGLALLLRDGRVMLVGWVVMGLSVWGIVELAFGEPEFQGWF